VASAMFRFATSGSFTSNFAGENAGLIARALSYFKGRIKEHLLVVVNTENMKSLSALDHRRREKFLYLVRPPMRVHQLISRFGHKKYYLYLSCHQPHLAFLVSQLIPHQMLSQSHSRCALIDYSERLFRRKILRFSLPLEALFRYLNALFFEAFNILFSRSTLIQGILQLAGKALPSRVVVTHNRSSNSCCPRLESAAGIETPNPDIRLL
jgi:hypothetical protein